MEHQFDELTRVLADATSRRRAFKTLGGFTLGALGTLFIGGRAGAQVTICGAGGPGGAGGRISRDGTCGANEYRCQVSSTTVCCYPCGIPRDRVHAACPAEVGPCNGQCCGGGQECVDGRCVARGSNCSQPSSCSETGGAPSFCRGGNCLCAPTTEGTLRCAGFLATCDQSVACSSSRECEAIFGAGSVCATGTCCEVPVGTCLPPCSGVF